MTAVMTAAAPDRPYADPPRHRRHVVYLATARRRARLTQLELADRTGISQSRISDLETTPHEVTTRRTRVLLAYALGVDPDRLAFGPNPKSIGAIKRERRRHRH